MLPSSNYDINLFIMDKLETYMCFFFAEEAKLTHLCNLSVFFWHKNLADSELQVYKLTDSMNVQHAGRLYYCQHFCVCMDLNSFAKDI
jgi:hypothetical protein